MRATAQDRDAAAMMGINVNRTISFTFLIAGALAGSAALLYALYITNIRYDEGFRLGLIAFTAAVVGGIGNLPGAVLGGLVIGDDRVVQQRARLGDAGKRLDAVDHLQRPDHHPRLPTRGLLGERTPEGGLMKLPASHPTPSRTFAPERFARGIIAARGAGLIMRSSSRLHDSRCSSAIGIGLALYVPSVGHAAARAASSCRSRRSRSRSSIRTTSTSSSSCRSSAPSPPSTRR